jgi:DNA-directed RNA polymerase omega subunit
MALHILGKDETQVQFLLRAPKNIKVIMSNSRNVSDSAVEQVGNRFDLVLIASARARELKRGHAPKVSNAGGITATVLKEIEEGKVGREYLKKIRD